MCSDNKANDNTLDVYSGELSSDKLELKNGNVVVHFKSCENMAEVPTGTVHHIVTSPPYFNAKLTE